MNILTAQEASKQSVPELVKTLETSGDQGLSSSEAGKRFQEYGPNQITETHVPMWKKLAANFWGPIPWMIEIAAVLSALIRHWDDFIIISFLLFLNAFIEFFQAYKAGNAIAALKKKLASNARVLRDGKWQTLEASALVPGDIIRIRLGDIIPADVKLVSGDYLLTDESALTGESLPVEKHPGDVAYSGAIAKQGEVISLVYATAGNTFFGRTAKLVDEAHSESHFQKAVVKIGDYLIALNFLLVAIIIIAGIYRHESIWEVIQFALVLTVAAIPAAMPAVLSVTMAVGALLLSGKEAIVSKLVAIEEMAGMDILCSDKTGTITKNELSVTTITPMDGATAADVLVYGMISSKEEDHDPLDDAIIARGKTEAEVPKRLDAMTQTQFKPFDPVSKRTEAEFTDGGKTGKASKGAPQVILDLCKADDQLRGTVNGLVESEGAKGCRTLGIARCDEAGAWAFVGIISLQDPPREDSAATIASAQQLGVDVKMVTGDHEAIAKEIARQVNIGDNILLTEELQNKSDSQALKMVEDADGFCQVFPEHKYRIVEILQKGEHIVGMTGDGVNDAPALKKADTGIAVAGATDAAKSAAAIVFTRPGLSVIVDAIKESRRIFQRMQSYAIYRISETQDILFFTVFSILLLQKYPVSALMIVLLAVFNDFPIMAIAYDHAEYGDRPEHWEMRKVIGVGTVLGLTNVMFTFALFYLGLHLFGTTWHPEVLGHTVLTQPLIDLRNAIVGHFGTLDFKQVQTLVFAELAIAGNLTVFLARCRGPLWETRPGKWLVLSTVVSKLIVSLLCAFGVWLMEPIGWYIVLVWVYACVQMLITDRMKLFAYDLFNHRGIRFHRFGRVAKS